MTENNLSPSPLSESELARRWGVTTRTLQGWRADGIGPKWVVLGKNTIRYQIEDVIEYEASRTKKNNQGE